MHKRVRSIRVGQFCGMGSPLLSLGFLFFARGWIALESPGDFIVSFFPILIRASDLADQIEVPVRSLEMGSIRSMTEEPSRVLVAETWMNIQPQ